MKWISIFILGFSLSLSSHSDKIEVANVAKINSSKDDFAPYVKGNILYFISKEGKGNKKYDTKVIRLGQDEHPKSLTRINNSQHTSLAFHPSGNAFFTRESQRNGSSHLFYDIYYFNSEFELNALPFNSRNYDVMNPCFTSDGRFMIFQSNMENEATGNDGGYDIFISRMDYDASKTPARLYFSEPVGVGLGVNTEFDETHPFYSNGLLYFTREEDNADIYSIPLTVHPTGATQLGEANKLKAPINSDADDFGYCTNGDQAFFVSNRDEGKGGYDIYEVK